MDAYFPSRTKWEGARIVQWEPHLSAAAAPRRYKRDPYPSLASPCPAQQHAAAHPPLPSSPRLAPASPAPRFDPNPRTRYSRRGRRYSQFPDISHRFPCQSSLPSPPSSRQCHPLFLFFEIFLLFLSGARGLGGFAAAGLAFWRLGEGWWSAVCAV